MKYFLFVVLFVSASTLVVAQEKDQEKLGGRLEEFRNALIAGDAGLLEKIVSDKLSYGHSSGLVEDKATFVKNATSKQVVFTRIDVSNQQIEISGDVGIVRMEASLFIDENGKSNQLNLLIMMVWQKQNGKWMLLARQAVRKPEPKLN